MIKAKHHKLLYPMFQRLSRFLIKRKFHSVSIHGEFTDNGKPLLVIANHISWWDGFWVEYLNHKIFRRKFHFMMLEEQLKKHWYFQYAGGYSIKKKSRSVLESIQYSIELLQHPANLVLMFPQGEIQSMHNDVIVFEKGIERIIDKATPETQLIFAANLIDYFSASKPTLYIYIRSYLARDLQKLEVEMEYNNFYKETLNSHKTKIS